MKQAARWNLGIGLLGLITCIGLNVWVFRYGVLAGLVGLNVTKHVGVAVLCQAVGVNQDQPALRRQRTEPHQAHHSLVGPHALTRDAT